MNKNILALFAVLAFLFVGSVPLQAADSKSPFEKVVGYGAKVTFYIGSFLSSGKAVGADRVANLVGYLNSIWQNVPGKDFFGKSAKFLSKHFSKIGWVFKGLNVGISAYKTVSSFIARNKKKFVEAVGETAGKVVGIIAKMKITVGISAIVATTVVSLGLTGGAALTAAVMGGAAIILAGNGVDYVYNNWGGKRIFESFAGLLYDTSSGILDYLSKTQNGSPGGSSGGKNSDVPVTLDALSW